MAGEDVIRHVWRARTAPSDRASQMRLLFRHLVIDTLQRGHHTDGSLEQLIQENG